MRLTGAELTIKLLERQGIEVIAGIPGGSNLPLYNALYDSKIEHVLVRHEQAGGFIAQGISRTTGKAAVCFATSGPGVTNLLTAIADAKVDSIPMVAITGQVSSNLLGTDAFQEIDTYGLTVPITKHNFIVRSAMELFEVIPESFEIAESGRPGPVVVDIPKDVQLEVIEFDSFPESKADRPYVAINYVNPIQKVAPLKKSDIEKMANMINEAKRPVLYIGGGIIHSDAHLLLKELATKGNIPVTSTLMALGTFPADSPLSLGMIGMHGARYTNMLLEEADLLIGLGVRFDDRATGNVTKFCTNAKVIHVEIDASEINKIKSTDLNIAGDISEVIKEVLPHINEDPRENWLSQVAEVKERNPFHFEVKEGSIHPIELIREVSKIVGPDAIITTDVGQHQMWVAQGYPFEKPRKFLTSGGLGTMGFGLPAAIGAAIANPDKKVVCFTGDGSILMNIQELATLADLELNLTVIILNNGHLGLVRQQQELFYDKHYIASKFKKNPDFVRISNGFGVKAYELSTIDNYKEILKVALTEKRPSLVNAPIRADENVLPMVPPGKANYEMIGGERNE